MKFKKPNSLLKKVLVKNKDHMEKVIGLVQVLKAYSNVEGNRLNIS